jgi:hypothetical protein
MRRSIAVLACLVSIAAAPARAQEASTPPTTPAATPAAAATDWPQPGQPVVVLLKDGQKLQGTLVSRDADGITLDVAGARMQLPADAIEQLAPPGSVAAAGRWPRDANRTRYLYSPSGFMLSQGEGYVSQTELVLTSVGYGLTDWLTLQAGAVLPVLLFDPRSTPFLLALKAGGSPSRYVHLAGGFQVIGIPGYANIPAAGFLFGTLTLGTEDLHLGVSAGPPFAFNRSDSALGAAIVSVSGNWRVGRSLALVSENWFVPVDGTTHAIGSLALRVLAGHLAVDAGFLFALGKTSTGPLPWLDFTWHWDGPAPPR